MTSLNTGLGQKRVELLHELIPEAKTIGALINPAGSNAQAIAAEFQSAARALGLSEVHQVNAGTERELDTAFATFAQLGVRGLVVGAHAFFSNRAEQLAALRIAMKCR
jgi:putative tryptophan/tyrosine transport system substrate-binding protein